MNTFPTVFADSSSPLVAQSLSKNGQNALEDLLKKGFIIRTGLAIQDARALSKLSLQRSIREYCPNDHTARFKDVETTRAWLQKGRETFLLVEKKSSVVAGYGWIGPGTTELIPRGTLTGALRISEDFQGQGLATPFLAVLLSYTRTLYPDDTLWFETWKSNSGAVHVYEKLGFKLVAMHHDTRPTFMHGDSVTDTRLFMVFGG